MSSAFDASQGMVVIRAVIWGPTAFTRVRLAIDTGATFTLLGEPIVRLLGYEPQNSAQTIRVTTGSVVPDCGDKSGTAKSAHTLPPTAMVDGLLGLDFFRGLRLMINFRTSRASLT